MRLGPPPRRNPIYVLKQNNCRGLCEMTFHDFAPRFVPPPRRETSELSVCLSNMCAREPQRNSREIFAPDCFITFMQFYCPRVARCVTYRRIFRIFRKSSSILVQRANQLFQTETVDQSHSPIAFTVVTALRPGFFGNRSHRMIMIRL